jgi:hypothetical protein
VPFLILFTFASLKSLISELAIVLWRDYLKKAVPGMAFFCAMQIYGLSMVEAMENAI